MILTHILLFTIGIASIAAPLWVHLRRGRVRKRTVVSSLYLMLAARQTSRTPRKIMNWPLFLLRSLLLLLLALGFGRLLIPAFGSSGVRAYAVFLIDTSGSMQAHADGNRWEQATKALQAAIANLDAGSQVAIMTSPAPEAPPQWENPSDANTRIANIKPGYAANRLAREMREAIRLLQQMPEDNPKFLHIISDFQRNALAGIDQITVPANIELRINKVGPLQARNRGIVVSVLSAGITDVATYGFTDGTSGNITLIENDDNPKNVAVSPGNVASRIRRDDQQATWTERKLILEDDDALAADNIAYETFRPQEMIPVWLFEPRKIPSTPQNRNMIRPIYEHATYFIRTALQPAFEKDLPESRFQPIMITQEDLPAAYASLEEPTAPQILFIPALAEIPPQLSELTQAIVERGGTVLFLTGPELNTTAYNEIFAPILPVSIGESERITFSPALAPISSRHALLGKLDTQTRRRFTHVTVRQRNTVERMNEAYTLAYFADGEPLVTERNIGSGRTYFINTSADRQWTDWPADSPLFVPFIHLLTTRAAGAEAVSPEHVPMLAGEPNTIQVDPAYAGQNVYFNDQQRQVTPNGYIEKVYFEKPGIYDLRLDDDTSIHQIAVNVPPSESVLDAYAEPIVMQRLESLRETSGESAIRWETHTDEGALAWKLAMALAALLLLIEPLVANRKKTS